MKEAKQKSTKAGQLPGGRVLTWLALVGTVLIANAGIMVLELVAGRLVARYLGQSLYTWTTIIGVVLMGMSVGNYLGGKLSDRLPALKLLAGIFLLAAAGCLSILPVNAWMGGWQAIRDLSWPARILTHVSITFLIPCAMLGAISPIITRFALEQIKVPGRTIGLVYAAAALGSIGGTFLTGFFLLTVRGSTAIIGCVAALMAVLSLFYGCAVFFVRSKPAPHEESVADLHESASQTPEQWSGWMKANATVFVSNASFMVLELAASRMATRHLGHSLYTWTALLGCVLGGITLGNYVGGRLADRFAPKRLLSVLFVLSAALCLSVPALNNWLGEGTLLDSLPWVARTFCHAALAFSLPAACLGTIGPVVARMALGLGRPPGNTLGNVYAWGTVGSVTGTFLTGYVLIDVLWPNGTICVLVLVLALMALLYNRRNPAAYATLAACIVAFAATFGPWAPTNALGRALHLREADDENRIYADHSQYSWISVTQNREEHQKRSLRLDQLLHSSVDLSAPELLRYDYQWIYEAVLDKYFPDRRPIAELMIGGGGYTFPRYTEVVRPGSHIEVIEIDPAVTRAAYAAFGLPEDTSIQVAHLDARNHVDDLLRMKQRGVATQPFDCILGDSFNQYSVPFQLTTVEFTRALKGLLADDGVYMLNLIDSFTNGLFLGSVVNTCRQVFPQVYVFSCLPAAMSSRDTFVVICSNRVLELEEMPHQLRQTYAYDGALLPPHALDDLVNRSGNRLLTDDHAPVDNLLASLANTKRSSLGTTTASLLAQGKGKEALRRIRLTMKEDPGNLDIQHHLGATLGRLGDHEGAITAFQIVLKGEPNNHEVHLNMATALAAIRKYEAAIPHYEAALRGNPASVNAHFVLGQYHMTEGRIREALHHLSETVRLAPDHGYGHYVFGKLLARQGKKEEALDHLSKAVLFLPDSKEAHQALGNLLISMQRPEEAETHFRHVLRIAPESLAVHVNLGNLLFEAGKLKEAEQCYVNAIQIKPNLALAHYNLGNTCAALGRHDEAAGHFRKAVAFDPGLAAAHEALEQAGEKSGVSP